MIDKRELRIGNYVKPNNAGMFKVLQIDGWRLRIGLDGARQGKWLPERLIKPIPLAPEILERCGFKHHKRHHILDGDVEFYSKGEFHVLKRDGFLIHAEFSEYIYEIGQPIKYLHQLQNLYYCLTAEELTFRG